MKKVLIIEDNENNRYMIRFLLEKFGIDTIEASTGEEGVAAAACQEPDLIIVDIQLPDINGLEVTRRIRGSKTGNDIPIIALTSYAMSGDRKQALGAGCSGYMEKPIVPEEFIARIRAYLSNSMGAKDNERFDR
ncbi:MAG: response regulator [Deltaproteobacteria bacterium]|nr:response regulator [Deltaproteobacteria bacterium]